MADPASYRPAPGTIPAQPGVYRFRDEEGRVLYVGKAKSLRNRLANYFQDEMALSPRIRRMVHTACRVEWVVVGSEVEALTLEYSWIKEFEPRFNVVFRDNKSYPYLAVSLGEEFPRAWITRERHRSGTRYFGPYTKVWAIRDTLDRLLTVFPMRSCTAGQFKQAQRTGRPCLYADIGRCTAPCVGRVTATEHRVNAEGVVEFMDGDSSAAIAQRRREMMAAAQAEEFERAARLRDEVAALEAVTERNVVVFDDNLDADVFGMEADEIEASVQVFFVRGGRIRGQQDWVSEEVSGVSTGELITQVLMQVYADPRYDAVSRQRESSNSVDDRKHTALGALPSEIWVPELPEEQADLEAWLGTRRGGPVHLKSPRRGDKAKLAETVHLNAQQALQRHKLARASDITVRSQALEELRDALGMERAPLRIECYDISHTQGRQQVGSMVVFEDGLAKKADYRHYIVRGPEGNGVPDDTAAMDEVLRRRLGRLVAGAAGDDAGGAEDAGKEAREAPEGLAEAAGLDGGGDEADVRRVNGSGDVNEGVGADAALGRPRRFAYRPDLLVVDGGLPQVNAAQRVIDELGADVRLVGLAKRLEEVWLPGEDFPVIFPRNSAALRLLQQLRDESHRFAITFHRKKRGQAMTRSALDAIPGLGPTKQKALLRAFGSLARIRRATPEELQTVPGIGPALATMVSTALRAEAPHAEQREENDNAAASTDTAPPASGSPGNVPS
ncbi:excinuclease ABC subunit UvrC [Actinobaculum sp. 352]|uniref:excinuclease ABC subunit UvrC n=1 Tax=Actinobaculum sp. 352 TaxID=2490946 RepID=UPI000F7F7A44|nr:excinuclease ABC subunit UvrC [Actinobaculum sp. 352]RTE49524.1 excinuclease ABC subunit UvrC [Actinobaculum sp. 352]